MKRTLILFAAATLAAGSALADDDLCHAGPKSGWKPQAELEAKLKNDGWQIKKVKIDEGCYEVYGMDEKGQRAEVYFHPVTFEAVKRD